MNKDFELCADFGTADKVRKFCATWDTEKLAAATVAFYRYADHGVMSTKPAHIGLWAEFAPGDNHVWQVVADTLYTMLGEAREREHPERVMVAR